ncbi:MAG: hypothetical protein H7145_05750 [Akkermansiaceae bacterium]|nr:hypothetical protein [Armatimonadota bacterium]
MKTAVAVSEATVVRRPNDRHIHVEKTGFPSRRNRRRQTTQGDKATALFIIGSGTKLNI